MLQAVFGLLLGGAMLAGLVRGQGAQVGAAMLAGAAEGVSSALSLAGGFALFCGLMAILRRAGAVEGLSRLVSPLLRRLFGPGLPPDALDSVTLNLTANLLGLGNAATPAGMEAARRMAAAGGMSDALCLFLVINSSSVQLLPTTVIALRAAAGSAAPDGILLPALLATAASTAVGILSCKIAEKIGRGSFWGKPLFGAQRAVSPRPPSEKG